ncbi:MAG TPA: bifunctional hydroxymethylpyrimidine kinase/phosphomethylpyrimidine kinase [bacterium]|nr:bifunctional hydroxymethylpyrimidine kinase/phosphomethylpyrimidine kinase [bacterium]HOL47959.1 bifunctional hydroxymethylpyrimidine kinase/phosphomethylpyrimidine kinase [bacterium]HPQ18053.1 bifunctional hydroxymethylpyrimidine kinase/phosphomethylpyrimidine kinase [bacterium]
MKKEKKKIVVSIAGSDSGAGAGIQADLKTFSASGVYGATIITAITAQNSVGVIGIQNLPTKIIDLQFDAIFTDFNVGAVKIGMVSTTKILKTIIKNLIKYKPKYIIVDPVMVSQTGAKLIKDDTIKILKKELLPLATLITPNRFEFEKLFNVKLNNVNDINNYFEIIQKNKLNGVLLKGGHFSEKQKKATDILFYKNKIYKFESPYVRTENLHGTGCSLSSAITANIIKTDDLINAIKISKKFIYNGIKNSFKIGDGPGPLNHFYKFFKF